MKRLIILIVFAICPFLSINGQDAIQRLKSDLSNKRINLNYSYKVQGDIPLTGNGTLVMQGKSYHVSGNGLDIICNGETRWTIDNQSKEIYIENAADTEPELFFTNPQLLMENLSQVSCSTCSLKGVYTDPCSKSKIDFSLSDIKATEPLAGSKEFDFNSSGFDESWVVTDLR